MITKELIFNLLLLLSASAIANLFNILPSFKPRLKNIILGFIFGFITILGMIFPYVMDQGLIFDGRSVVLSLVSFFYGFSSGLIAGIIALIYRISIGGPGVYAGTLTIIFSVAIGLIFNFLFFKRKKFELSNYTLILFNVIIHIFVYVSMYSVLSPYRPQVLQQMAFPFLVVYPIIGFITGKILWLQLDYINKANKIKESEEKFSVLFYRSIIPMLIVEKRTLVIVDVNEPFLLLTGQEKNEILNKSISELKLFEEKSLNDIIIPRLRSKVQFKNFETEILTKSGQKVDVIFCYDEISINSEDFFIISLVDITNQIEATKEILKLNRIYLLLSEINQLIVRTKDVDQLIKNACEIAVKNSSFLAVFIAFYDKLKNSLKVVYSAGPAKDYFKNMEISVNNERFEIYPSLRCFKFKKQEIINNWETDPAVEPIRDLALKYGFKSSATFPLIVHNEIFGIFGFYSAEKNYFDSPEIELLQELSKDISFAIESIENENKRKEAEFKLKENVRFLSTLIKNLPGFIYRCRNDRDWTMEYITPQVEEITGYKPEELIYNRDFSFNDLIHPDYRDYLWEKWQRVLAEKSVFEDEYPIITKSGEIKWVWERGRGIFDDNDNLICLEGFITDITEKIKFRDQLIETNEKLKLLVEGIPYFFFYTHDTEGRITYISPSVEKITGYTVSEWIGNNSWFLTDNPINELARENTRKVLRGEPGKFPIYIEIYHKNSDKIILEIFEVPYYKEGKIIGLHGVARDVTVEKRYEEKLIKSEEKFRKLFKEHSAVKIIFDPETEKIYDVNNAAIKFFGYDYNEMVNMTMRNLAVEARENILKKVTEVREKGSPLIETKYKLKDGSIKDVAVFFSNVEIDSKNYIHLIIIDITEAKKLEKEIELERYKFQQLFDNSPIAITMIDKAQKIVTTNSQFLNFFNLKQDEATGKIITEICCKEDFDITLKSFINRVLNGEKHSTETYIQKLNGDFAYVQLMGLPIFISGEIIGAFIMIVDITKIKKAEEDMRAAKELAELANKMKDTFIANISHEIRTPLNAILGYNELIKEITLDYLDQEEQNYFNIIKSAGDRLMRTIEMIMNYSRIVSGDMPIKKEIINLNDILENLYNEFQIRATQKNLEFTLTNECGDIKIFADRYCITQAIANLIDNAIKYTKKGNVKVSLRRNENSEIELEISDTGIGISEEYQKRIFEPYTQQELGWNRPYEGVGLGLALVKNYLNLNGIDITFTSKENVGTTFIIHFKGTEVKD